MMRDLYHAWTNLHILCIHEINIGTVRSCDIVTMSIIDYTITQVFQID